VLKILLVDQNPDRASILESLLRDAGHQVVARRQADGSLVDHVKALAPDIIVVDLTAPDRDSLESLANVSRNDPRPIAMFVDDSDAQLAHQAIKAGVTAYVVDGIGSNSVAPVLSAAIAQFSQFQALRDELAAAKSSLAERKVIERAKGLLMTERGLSEADAYHALRKLAMDRGTRLVDIADQLLTVSKLLKG
jgi:two-component system, response regulator / RNA-binding antiterminator